MNIHGITTLILATLGGPVWSTVYTPCGFARTLYKLLEKEPRMLKEIPLLVCIAGYQRFDTDYLAGYEPKTDHGIEHSFHGVFGLLYTDMDQSYPEIYHSKLRKYFPMGLDRGMVLNSRESLSLVEHLNIRNHKSKPPLVFNTDLLFPSDTARKSTFTKFEDRINQDLKNFLEKVLHVNDATTTKHPNYDFYKTICSKPHVRELSCRLNDYVLTNYKVYEPLNPGLLDEYRRVPHPTDDQPFIHTAEYI
ncbi:hypothetical protein GE061_009325 [Apolygus lucorum]|uniref:Uncharacterized protein n=1 Tax=Apolygus lucorum TaxID=248454 RepID=A0A8S9XZV1_APOLU|nr:hypothetical protein GE061_009325 [Apolygus lucorum]